MKMRGITQRIRLEISRKNKIGTEKKKLIAAFLIFVILVLSFGITRQTLGKFSKSFLLTDSALVSKLDIDITAPDEFILEQNGDFLKLHFTQNANTKDFSFQVFNNGEVGVVCTPHINNGVVYHIFVSGAACTEFIVNAKDTVNFRLIVESSRLDGNIKEAKFSIDIQQLEGGSHI